MNMQFKEILGSCHWTKINPIAKGWSNDTKYYIETTEGEYFLLRLSDISQYKNKKRDYEVIKQLDEF